MLSDLDASGIPNVPEPPSPMNAMCTLIVKPSPERGDDNESSLGKPESEFDSVHESTSSSDHSMLLEAQQALAQELILEAEANAAIRKAKVEAARIAVALAAHKASSRDSQRSRTRQKISPDATSMSVTGLHHTGEGPSLRTDLSNLIFRELGPMLEEEPQGEPELASCDLPMNMRIQQVEEAAAQRHQQAMTLEREELRQLHELESLTQQASFRENGMS
jgi:hypothetical protein